MDDDVEKELKYLSAIRRGGEVAIDIGANLGFYTYALAKHYAKVISYEINSDLTDYLLAANLRNVQVIHVGLSDTKGEATLFIPIRQGIRLTGWASLHRYNCPDTNEHLEKQVEISKLDEYQLKNISFIKMDVEGHELSALKGARQTLINNRPIVLIEVRDHNLDQVTSFMKALFYKRTKLDELIGIVGSKENYIFIPQEMSVEQNENSCRT